ncbi:MAG: glycosyltransferase family 4 protein [Sphingomonas sp.]|jgi:glycosyltransferase involved in cell wall biosynthesis|uniref:glycosyltransferase family 4 protein n=1 Tax=Sphingomonas sp. TaxID=28214 RepID=UPI003567C6D7
MRIAICTTPFVPNIGGIENLSEMTADALGRGGDDVTVLTLQPGGPMPDRAYRLIRRPSFAKAYAVCRGADAAIMPNIGLKLMPAILAAGTPLFVWHQHEFRDPKMPLHKLTMSQHAKRLLIEHRVRANLGCSDFITARLPDRRPKLTLTNPYDAKLFFADPGIVRDRDLVVVGRLVPAKGCDVVLRAMALPGGPLGTARLSVVGDGPARADSEALAVSLGIADRVDFLGAQTGDTLRRTLNAHRVMIVPSVWAEPFGIVALEGLASGCSMVVSDIGGLPQAIGASGRTFVAGDPVSAATAIAAALADPADPADPARVAHLARHTAEAIAAQLRSAIVRFGKR